MAIVSRELDVMNTEYMETRHQEEIERMVRNHEMEVVKERGVTKENEAKYKEREVQHEINVNQLNLFYEAKARDIKTKYMKIYTF